MAVASIGLAVIGTGRIGAVHARNVARSIPGAQLVGVADVDLAAAARLAAQLGVRHTDQPQVLLSDKDVQGVIIATPTATHATLIEQAAASGKHIFCEKPISLEPSVTGAALRSAAQAGVFLQVGFQRRYDPEFARARTFVESGALGSVRLLRLVARDHGLPSVDYLRTSGGQFKDQMIHEFDAARWLLAPATVEEVYATGSVLVEPSLASFGDIDTGVVLLRYRSGAIGIIDASREAIYGYDARAELHGSNGMILVGQSRLRNGELLDASCATADVTSFIERFADAYRAEISAFARSIREGNAPTVGARDDLEAMRIATAADRSRSEHRPVKLAEVSDA